MLFTILTGLNVSAQALVLNVGQSARVSYSPGAFGPGTPPFGFIALGFNFSTSDPFDNNESLTYNVYSPTNVLLGSGPFDAGSSVYTSGLFGALTVSVFPSPQLDSTSFYATVTNTSTTGSFDLIGGQADLYNFSGVSQFGSVGTVSAVPELATWTLMALGFGALGGFAGRRRLRPWTVGLS
jgi:hypothetical protein